MTLNLKLKMRSDGSDEPRPSRREGAIEFAVGWTRCVGLLAFAWALHGEPVWADGLSPGSPTLIASDKMDRRFVEPLLTTVADAAAIGWSKEYLPFNRMLMMAEKGGAIVFGMAKTPDREKRFFFSDPVLLGYGWLVKLRSSNLQFNTLQDLHWHSICVFQGTSMGAEFDAAKDVLFPVESVSGGLDRGLAMLRAKRCEALAFVSHLGPTASTLEARLRADGLGASDLVVLAKPVLVTPVHFAVRKGDALAALLPRLNQAVKSRRQTIDQLVIEK